MQSQQLAPRLPTTTELSLIQQLFARSFAFSYEHNRRNIEHPWYGFWNHVLIDIVKDSRNLIIFPQFLVWASPEGYKDLGAEEPEAEQEEEKESESVQESEEKESEPELEAPRRPQTRSQTKRQQELVELLQIAKQAPQHPDSVEESAPVMVHTHAPTASSSMAGSVATITLPKGSSARIADFAILKICESTPSSNVNPTKPEHIKATSCTVKLLVEIKRLASRKLEGEVLKNQIEGMKQMAAHDIDIQAALLFEQSKDIKSVLAIAASGNHWSHTILKRENLNHDVFKELSIDLNYKEKYVAPVWTPTMPLEDSLDELQKLFNAVRKY